jgi:hypothetical protein
MTVFCQPPPDANVHHVNVQMLAIHIYICTPTAFRPVPQHRDGMILQAYLFVILRPFHARNAIAEAHAYFS